MKYAGRNCIEKEFCWELCILLIKIIGSFTVTADAKEPSKVERFNQYYCNHILYSVFARKIKKSMIFSEPINNKKIKV